MIDANELEMEGIRGKHLAEGGENERDSVVTMARKRQEKGKKTDITLVITKSETIKELTI